MKSLNICQDRSFFFFLTNDNIPWWPKHRLVGTHTLSISQLFLSHWTFWRWRWIHVNPGIWVAQTLGFPIWVWINTYENTIFRGMNIHLPAILMWTTGVQGFDTLPFIKLLHTHIIQTFWPSAAKSCGLSTSVRCGFCVAGENRWPQRRTVWHAGPGRK